MKTYQAKTVQEILQIPRHRHDYIIIKIGIEPDIEKASGRGTTHIFSFSKLMEIAIASAAIDIGMTPESVKKAVEFIRKYDPIYKLNIFEKDITGQNQILYHTGFALGVAYFWITIDGNVIEYQQFKKPSDMKLVLSKDAPRYSHLENGDGWGFPDDPKPNEFKSYSTLNLSAIKGYVLSKA